jgi:hypothetical protein
MIYVNEKLWNERISHGFNLNYDFFNNKDILEVGCGATGIFFSQKYKNKDWYFSVNSR